MGEKFVTFFKKPYVLFTLIIFIGAFFRLVYLQYVPNAIGGDELTYFLTAKSVFLSGYDFTHTWNPLMVLFFKYPPGTLQAELPYFISLAVSPFPFSLLQARIMYALLSIGTIPLIYFITKKLLGTPTALFASLLMAINPWEIYIGRTSYELVPALFFFLVSLLILLYAKRAKTLFVLPILMLSFYSYIGTKVFFLPFIFTTIWYVYTTEEYKKSKKYYIYILLFSVLFILLYAALLFLTNQENRSTDLFTPFSPKLGEQVDVIRRLSIANPLLSFFENKPVLYFKIIVEKLLNTLSFNYLFSSGDLFFSVPRHGVFYVLDLPFLFLGMIFLFFKKKKIFVFLGLLAVFSLLPQLLQGSETRNFTPHISLFFPFAFIGIAFGVTSILQHVKYKKITTCIIIFLYAILSLNFMQSYLFQFPIQGHFDFKLRILSSYVNRVQKNTKVTIYTNAPYDSFQKYLFYGDAMNKDTLPIIQNSLNTNTFTLGNITFSNCPGKIPNKNHKGILIIDVNCGIKLKNATPILLPQLKDSGGLYLIYNDAICKNVELGTYIQNLKISDFGVEKLSNSSFCKAYLIH
ncbi:MAG TPA: glycosyltransferase family 39 protein [Candidatus Levybacteria bacterium]|mgnify:CR=1 FL=1|nr:glycosyltransferase family 39 protein [Candidatus Levybacteria bacterium]